MNYENGLKRTMSNLDEIVKTIQDAREAVYSKEWIVHSRPQAMYDTEVHTFHNSLHKSSMDDNVEKTIEKFKYSFDNWIKSHKRISFTGLDAFPDRTVTLGVTHQLDELHMVYKHQIVVLEGDYKYHWRLDPQIWCRRLETLKELDVLVLAVPFPKNASMHPDTLAILDRCNELNIPVHIDAAWFGCCRDIQFNCDHPAIQTVTFSLSKALGMGCHRIGVRYAREPQHGPIQIMNEFNYVNVADVWIGLQLMEKFGPDFWWNKYAVHYNKVCRDFELIPAKAIHVAWNDQKNLVGIRNLLRYLGGGKLDTL